jgi:acetylornithine deacetylase/succinyl-diaminopimelate desuccinylase-like protein
VCKGETVWLSVALDFCCWSGRDPLVTMAFMNADSAFLARLRSHVNRQRLVETARRLIEVPSRTGEAGAVSDRLAEILQAEGFTVERTAAGYPQSPAVVVRLESGRPGPSLQFDGHLDTVHLPFIPPAVDDGRLTGSGASDMKAGVAAAVEAVRALRDAGGLFAGSVLLTAHDLHEAPWGDGRQLDQMIREGTHGDAVLLPEPMRDVLPIAGRGAATWKVVIRRPGAPVHEVMRPSQEPSVLAAGARLVARLGQIDSELAGTPHPVCGAASVFIGQFHGGEIYNQYPQSAWLEGTRRWLPGTDPSSVERDFRAGLADLAAETRTTIDCEWKFIRDSFALDPADTLVAAFQRCYQATSGGQPLPTGPKPFVDDGNSFYANAGVPSITHGPRAGGQHTVLEWVDIDDLVRIAWLYAAIATEYCQTVPPHPRPPPQGGRGLSNVT